MHVYPQAAGSFLSKPATRPANDHRPSVHGLRSTPLRYLLKPLVVILPGGAHQPVPKRKVEAIVALKILVVLVVVNGRIEPFAQPMAVGALGKKFVAQVPIYIIDRHKYQKSHDMHKMDGDGKGKYIDNTRLHHGFRRAKGKRSPGRRVGTFVVQEVKEFEQFGMVHQAVRKIEIGVMHQQHHQKYQYIIRGTVFSKLGIKSSVGLDGRVVEHQRHQCKYEKSDDGKKHFAAVIAALGPTLLYFFEERFAFVPYIKHQKGDTGKQQIAYCRE
jgi:hypothetical protein